MSPQPYPPFEVHTPPELSGETPGRYRVAIIGAGPIGLAAAIDLAQHGIPVVVLDEHNEVSVGSRAICWAKRTLEIMDRLGVGEPMVEKGVTWQTGRLFHGANEVYHFDLLPDAGYRMPAFINLQQYHVEHYLVNRARQFPDLIDLRFKNNVVEHEIHGTEVSLIIDTPDGQYTLAAEYVLACDGASSPTRNRIGLAFEGESFEERFLIADIHMQDDPFPDANKPERWFWFKPPFHKGQSALLHKQPDNIYRIDLQLGPDADPELEKQVDRVIPRIRQVVGDRPFEVEWVSVYRFRCARLAKFVHDRLIFVGDSAHVVSPFGARGGNGGMHDVDNLCWKLAAILKGHAPSHLLQTYEEERGHGADENIRHSARATRFMSPTSANERLFRDEILNLAEELPFARCMINSGRLSTPCVLKGMTLQSEESPTQCDSVAVLPTASEPGSVAPDLPLPNGDWLLNQLGNQFTLLLVGDIKPLDGKTIEGLAILSIKEKNDIKEKNYIASRYGNAAYLIRPDQHIAARWSPDEFCAEVVATALQRARGLTPLAAAV